MTHHNNGFNTFFLQKGSKPEDKRLFCTCVQAACCGTPLQQAGGSVLHRVLQQH